MEKGFILVPRSIDESWVWQKPSELKRWLDLLIQASWKNQTVRFGGQYVHLQRGQLATTIRLLAGRWCCSAHTVITFLDVLRKEGMIAYEPNKKFSVITIKNFNRYQGKGTASETEPAIGENSAEYGGARMPVPERNLQPEMQQIKEDGKKIDNNIKKYLSLSPRACEENYFSEIESNGNFLEQTAKGYDMTTAEVAVWLGKFKFEIMATEHFHNDCRDLKGHFYKWLGIKLEKQKRYERSSEKGGGSEFDNIYKARRGTDVKPHTAKDYGTRL